MDDIREFEVNNWLVNEDGICQVLGLANINTPLIMATWTPPIVNEFIFDN